MKMNLSICKRAFTMLAAMLWAVCAFAQTPSVTGFTSVDPKDRETELSNGSTLFLGHPSLIVHYTAPVTKTYWSIEQNGVEVLTGTDNGEHSGQDFADISLKSILTETLKAGSLNCGNITFKITKVEYPGGTASNVSSLSLNLTDAPSINSFYPVSATPGKGLQELKPHATIYIYYEPGYKVLNCNTHFIQNDAVKGTVMYNPTNPQNPTNVVCVKKTELPSIIDELQLATGPVLIKITDVTYISPIDGSEKTFVITNETYPSVEYFYNGNTGSLVSETKPADNTVLSYYPADSSEGLISFTFDRAFEPNGLKAQLEYGDMGTPSNYAVFNVPFTCSNNNTTLTVDLRGMLNNVATMVPYAHFIDDSGNPGDPPASIQLMIAPLLTPDGSSFVTTATSDESETVYYLYNKLHRSYKYSDITFPDPVLNSVLFYAKSNPGQKQTEITPDVDMIEIEVSNLEVIASAAVKFSVDAGDFKVSNAILGNGTVSAALPPEVVSDGGNSLVISLVDVVYSVDDGVNHTIKPLDFANHNVTNNIETIADLCAQNDGKQVVLMAKNAKVTMANDDAGYIFIEDETGAVQVMTSDFSPIFQQGTAISGSLKGIYQGEGLFVIDKAASQFEAMDADVTTGTLFAPDEAVKPENRFRLATFVASASCPIVYDDENGYVIIGNKLVSVNDFLPQDFSFSGEIESVTGIIYIPSNSSPMLILRDANDVKFKTPGSISAIISESGVGDADVYSISGQLVRKAGEPLVGLKGIFIMGNKKIMVE